MATVDELSTTRTSAGAVQGRILPLQAPPADAAVARANPMSTITFYGKNSVGKPLSVRFFSKTRHVVWPSATKAYVLPADRKIYYIQLKCERREKICVGAWAPKIPNVYWGVGPQGNKACSSCCFTCNGGSVGAEFVR
jgi:hypothetical protein